MSVLTSAPDAPADTAMIGKRNEIPVASNRRKAVFAGRPMGHLRVHVRSGGSSPTRARYPDGACVGKWRHLRKDTKGLSLGAMAKRRRTTAHRPFEQPRIRIRK